MSFVPGQSNGAPLGFSGAGIVRLPDAVATLDNGVIGSLQVITPTALRVVNLPSLATVKDGDMFSIRNLAGGQALTLTPFAGDFINDAGATVAQAADTTVTLVADNAADTPTWITL